MSTLDSGPQEQLRVPRQGGYIPERVGHFSQDALISERSVSFRS